jgi:hypothetical protein
MNANNPTDPIADRLREARQTQRADSEAAAGERALVADFQRQADKTAPEEVRRIEEMFATRCADINAAKDADDPEFHFNAATHELRAGQQFATYLELTEGFSPYRLDMVSGLRRDAAQVFAPGFEPEYESSHWRLLARLDDRGFFWESDGERLSTEEVIEQGLKAVVDNLTR